jgi:hypothetical protein
VPVLLAVIGLTALGTEARGVVFAAVRSRRNPLR